MALLLIAYIGLMAAGTLWVLYRVVVFVRNQRDRERRWGGDVFEAELAAFIEEFKRNHQKREAGQELVLPADTEESCQGALVPLPSVSALLPLDQGQA